MVAEIHSCTSTAVSPALHQQIWAQSQPPHVLAVCPQTSYLAPLFHGLLVFLEEMSSTS